MTKKAKAKKNVRAPKAKAPVAVRDLPEPREVKGGTNYMRKSGELKAL